MGVPEEEIQPVKDEDDGDVLTDGFDNLTRAAENDHLRVSTR